eukprot:7039330-Prymnesium_polylepis.1
MQAQKPTEQDAPRPGAPLRRRRNVRYKFLNDGHIGAHPRPLPPRSAAYHLGAQVPHTLLPQRRAR